MACLDKAFGGELFVGDGDGRAGHTHLAGKCARGRQQPVDPVHPRQNLIPQGIVDLARAHAAGPGSGIGLHLDHPHSKPAFARADDVGMWF
jgi:hypothetical protein